jgi:hypothetical protein
MLPVFSFAAMCDLNCRVSAIPQMAMHSQRSSHAAGAQFHHHRHVSAEAGHCPPNAGARSALDAHQAADGQRCCDGGLPAATAPCGIALQNESQEQTATPAFSDNLAPAVASVSIIQPANHRFVAASLVPVSASKSLILKI